MIKKYCKKCGEPIILSEISSHYIHDRKTPYALYYCLDKNSNWPDDRKSAEFDPIKYRNDLLEEILKR